MLVYFHIDELARDAVVASALKKELVNRGSKLVYGNRFTTDYFLRHIDTTIFDAIVLPSLMHYFLAFPNKNSLPNNIYILQTEAIGQATGTLRRLNGKYFGDDHEKFSPWHESVAGFLLWGYAHINPFREFFPSYLDKCRVVGHPRLSKSCKKVASKVKKTKIVVGFVSRFNLLSPFDNRIPFESVVSSMRFGKESFPLFENSNNRDVEDMFYTEIIDFRVMLQILMTLDQNKYTLTVRPHPRENRLGWIKLAKKLNLNISISTWDEPFGHWLNDVDYIVTPPSTSLYDVFHYGKKAILTSGVVSSRAEHTLTESDDNNQILKGLCTPKSVDEIVKLIETGDIPYDSENVNLRLQEQVAADIADDSILNIINALSEMRKNTSDTTNRNFKIFSFKVISLFLAHLKYIKSKLLRRVEQGSSFNLTIKKIRWIDLLTLTK